MLKKSKGKLALSNNGEQVIHITEERGTLIQNCGRTENGEHVLSLNEGLFLCLNGLLRIDSDFLIEKRCCENHGVNLTTQSMSLFELGVKNCNDPDGTLLFSRETQAGRISKLSNLKKLHAVLPDDNVYDWLDLRIEDNFEDDEPEVYAYLEVLQSNAYFHIQKLKSSSITR